MAKKTIITTCPCGSGQVLQRCCEPYLQRQDYPLTAEALMRSRYTAYVLGNVDYLQTTWHPNTRPATLILDDSCRWVALEVVKTQAGKATDIQGTVHFRAYYKLATGRGGRLEEISQFERIDQQWFYLMGE
ncbi:YchJ family protein [Beggiatoa leptomitoformis]|uniref:UPF0225 protein BLE401_15075 n=1 Tax=Beggiatoa leptomitoformis TaxID=288004 RepID=A0A2N9YHM7_9GAMM|nr:YchJ family metal-binding protein [Beggiatoa leptomitoformis]ALG67857.1 hypothetical protein AL038_09235 [Beggiatoa leptomitoformis]AUI69885.1 hypothetical protein BLE401_15075 [Beggiatoa leptomitoformis]